MTAEPKSPSAELAEDTGRGSVTMWIARLNEADSGAAQEEIWKRYFRRLVGLARTKLGDSPRRAEDEDDVAVAALQSFFQDAEAGRFPDLKDRTNLWPLLAKITARKAINQRKRQLAAKRGGGKVRGESAVGLPASGEPRPLSDLIVDDLTPDFLVALRDEYQRLMELLPDEQLRQIVRLKLAGHANREIAQELNVVERTAERKLQLIRSYWSQEVD